MIWLTDYNFSWIVLNLWSCKLRGSNGNLNLNQILQYNIVGSDMLFSCGRITNFGDNSTLLLVIVTIMSGFYIHPFIPVSNEYAYIFKVLLKKEAGHDSRAV
jgi:hypothetical protein